MHVLSDRFICLSNQFESLSLNMSGNCHDIHVSMYINSIVLTAEDIKTTDTVAVTI